MKNKLNLLIWILCGITDELDVAITKGYLPNP